MFLSQFLTIAFVHLIAVMSPGPDFAMVTRNSLLYSRNSGVYTSVGLALGIMVHVTYCLFGIGLIISQSIVVFNTIKYAGALYLIYIGYKSLKSKVKNPSETEATIGEHRMLSPIHSIRSGFLTNVLNPKATLFFLALFTQVINPETPKIVQSIYGLEMVIMTFVWFSIVSIFFSNYKIKTKISKISHYIDRFTGAVLIVLGIKVALSNHK